MFDHWDSCVVRLRDEPVHVDIHKMWPYLAGQSVSLAPRDARRHGLRIDTFQPGRLVAWVRQTSGAWLAVVESTAHSGDGTAEVPMTLWTPAQAVRPDRRHPRKKSGAEDGP